MPKRSKKRKLTPKEEAVIAETVRAMNAGEKFSLAKSVDKVYNVTKESSAKNIASQKMNNDMFRNALLVALEDRRIIGADSKVEKVLVEGLDAEREGDPDHRIRLDYAKEINKISGVYAPQKLETKSMSLNLNMSDEEMKQKIRELQGELEDV
jgi:hypothetical protein